MDSTGISATQLTKYSEIMKCLRLVPFSNEATKWFKLIFVGIRKYVEFILIALIGTNRRVMLKNMPAYLCMLKNNYLV